MQQTAPFAPLPPAFKSARTAPLCTDWEGKANRDGIEMTVTARVFPAGFVDTRVAIRNVSARQIYGETVKMVLAYWKFAKDSVVRRSWLVEKKLPAGPGTVDIPK